MTTTATPTSNLAGLEGPALRTPRSAAYAGIVFAVLLMISLATIRLTVTANPDDPRDWLYDSRQRSVVLVALSLMPVAAIAFLWFLGVIRDRLGAREDRFFATLFLGSGLIFVALLLVAEAAAAGMIVSVDSNGSSFGESDAWTLGRNATLEFVSAGLQMLGVFATATSTLLLRTSIGPRWLAIVGYGISIVMITSHYFFAWSALLFPIWVLAVSVAILLADGRRNRASPA